MKISVDELLKNSFVITIEDGRYDVFKKLFSRSFGSDVLPKRFDGCVDRSLKPVERCTKSHASVVKIAKERHLPFVVIFEDDAYPRNGVRESVEDVLSDVPECSIAVLGWNRYGSASRIDGRWSKLKDWAWGSHAYMVLGNAYEEYISEYDRDPHRTADGFFDFFGNRTVLSNKNMFIQYNSSKSMNGYSGYVFDNGKHSSPPGGFSRIENLLCDTSDSHIESKSPSIHSSSTTYEISSIPYFYGTL